MARRGPKARIDEAEVVEMAATMHQAAIARKLGVTRQRVSQILKKHSTTSVPFTEPYPPIEWTVEAIQRFWKKVRMGDGCWEWQAAGRDGRYGVVRISEHFYPTHRVSWEMHFGIIPPGMVVCHKCDNPPCVRPEHLFLGTRSDNALDMVAKGRGRWQTKKVA